MSDAGPALACRDVSVDLGGAPILRQVDLEVRRGEWLTLVGPNGAGKTTLLRYICGLVAGTGSLTLGGEDAGARSRRERAKLLALVPQDPVVPPGLAVVDYVLLGRAPHLRPLASEGPGDLAAVRGALARLDLLDFADRTLATLSGGERQRVFLARALAQDAPLLLLDEPTTSLDVGHSQQVLELVDELRHDRGLSVVSTMHDLTLAGQYADRLVLLHQGRVVADGKAGEVLTEENLTRYYDANVRVVDDGRGPVIVPARRCSAHGAAPVGSG